jgi:hypothetical protein
LKVSSASESDSFNSTSASFWGRLLSALAGETGAHVDDDGGEDRRELLRF